MYKEICININLSTLWFIKLMEGKTSPSPPLQPTTPTRHVTPPPTAPKPNQLPSKPSSYQHHTAVKKLSSLLQEEPPALSKKEEKKKVREVKEIVKELKHIKAAIDKQKVCGVYQCVFRL